EGELAPDVDDAVTTGGEQQALPRVHHGQCQHGIAVAPPHIHRRHLHHAAPPPSPCPSTSSSSCPARACICVPLTACSCPPACLCSGGARTAASLARRVHVEGGRCLLRWVAWDR
ncbi:unnamed protein product, partial [Closterium sp. NIES-54]